MRHSNRDENQKVKQQAAQPVKVKQKSGLYSKLKTGCCLIIIAGLIAGGLYVYRFYQDAKAEIDAEIDKNKGLYQETKETIDKANENYQEINSAVEHGEELINKLEGAKNIFDN